MATTVTSNGEATSALSAALAAAGYTNQGLSELATVQLAVSNLITAPTLTGPVVLTSTTDSTSSTTGALKTAGGLGVAKAANIGTTLGVTGRTTLTGGLTLGSPTTLSAINLEGITLADNTNAIRGASVNPTRASGWTSFSGTISTAPTQCYTDYRELHTTSTAEVLGFGMFPYMDSGASCKSMYAAQLIAYASTGSTVAAAVSAGDGIFALWGKTVIDGASVNASGVMAAAWLSFQANTTDVQALDSSMINMEVASGGVNAIIKFQCSAAKGATYFVNFENNGEPAEKTTAKTTAVNDVVGNIAVLVGDQVGYINIHSAKAT